MDKLSLASQNSDTLVFLEDDLSAGNRESIFPTRGLFKRFTSEITLLLLNFNRRRWERYERLVDGMRQNNSKNSTKKKASGQQQLNISKSIVESVSAGLNAFEQRKGFLNMEVSLISLAMELNTNSSYLSKIINHTKQKPFKKYLNDLRVAYAHKELQVNTNMRKYTLEAIAHDFGFKSAENFSKKFSEVYGVYPSIFLRALGSSR
jgi:AraC-like DNA-binding protein